MLSRRRLIAICALVLVGPTLIAPIPIWHAHPVPPATPTDAGHDAFACGGCTPHAGHPETDQSPLPRTPALHAPCATCAIAATISVAAAFDSPPLIETGSMPCVSMPLSRPAQQIIVEPRPRGPPASHFA